LLTAGTVDAILLFNILHAENPDALLKASAELLRPGAPVLAVHWRSDISTPRGPDLSIRPRPEQIARLAQQTKLLALEQTHLLAP